MKSQAEIQEVHDTLCAVITGEVRIPMKPGQRDTMASACAALCWVLGEKDHAPAAVFATDLASLARAIKALGYTQHKAAEPFSGPPPGSPPRN